MNAEQGRISWRWVPWGVMGFGLLLFAGGIAFLIATDSFPGPDVTPAEVHRIKRTEDRVSPILFVGVGDFLIGFLLLLAQIVARFFRRLTDRPAATRLERTMSR